MASCPDVGTGGRGLGGGEGDRTFWEGNADEYFHMLSYHILIRKSMQTGCMTCLRSPCVSDTELAEPESLSAHTSRKPLVRASKGLSLLSPWTRWGLRPREGKKVTYVGTKARAGRRLELGAPVTV